MSAEGTVLTAFSRVPTLKQPRCLPPPGTSEHAAFSRKPSLMHPCLVAVTLSFRCSRYGFPHLSFDLITLCSVLTVHSVPCYHVTLPAAHSVWTPVTPTPARGPEQTPGTDTGNEGTKET